MTKETKEEKIDGLFYLLYEHIRDLSNPTNKTVIDQVIIDRRDLLERLVSRILCMVDGVSGQISGEEVRGVLTRSKGIMLHDAWVDYCKKR